MSRIPECSFMHLTLGKRKHTQVNTKLTKIFLLAINLRFVLRFIDNNFCNLYVLQLCMRITIIYSIAYIIYTSYENRKNYYEKG